MTAFEYVILIEGRRPNWPTWRKLKLMHGLSEREQRGQHMWLRVLRASHVKALRRVGL